MASKDLTERLLELQSFFEISQALSSSLDLHAVLDQVLLASMQRMMSSKGIFLLHKGNNCYVVELLKGLPDALLGQTLTIGSVPPRHFLTTELDKDDHPWVDFFHGSDIYFLFPVHFRDSSLGLLGVGGKSSSASYSEAEIAFLSSLVNISAANIAMSLAYEELRQVNLRLDRKVQELNTLFDIGKELNSTLDAKKIMKLLGYALMGQMLIQRYLILVERDDLTRLIEAKGCPALEAEFQRDHSLWRLLGEINHPYVLGQAAGNAIDARLRDAGFAAVVPMLSQDTTRGIIALGNKLSGKPYLDDELEFLSTLGNQAVTSLENAWYFDEALEKKRLEEELALAREIQQKLFPKTLPEILGYEIAARNLPTKQVGGDYFDVIQIDGAHFGLSIADVSGKGMPAALLMSNLQASLHALIAEVPSMTTIVEKINNLIYRNTEPSKYITFFYGLLDIDKNAFTYINAGHNAPFLIRADKSYQRLDKGGLPLGLLPNMAYEQDTVLLYPGDCMVFYTDGVTEAGNQQEEEFGEQRLQLAIDESIYASAGELLQEIAARVEDFSRGLPQADDITLMVVKAKT
jgi:sigma-B regulation protein RsbU (phosphoserine phosphatase)